MLSAPQDVFGMGSANYSINSDVIGSEGGFGSSTNYQVNDTMGEVGTGDSLSASYGNQAGFWSAASMATISITAPSDVTMGAITGTGQSALATNSATWNIKTNNFSGYSLSWQASTAAMTSSTDTVAAYTPAIASTPETWSVASTDSEWGAHLGSASTTVNTTTWGALDTYAGGKWLNVNNTASFTIASRATKTLSTGDDEIVHFGAEIGASSFQPTGTYTVNVTMTAVTL